MDSGREEETSLPFRPAAFDEGGEALFGRFGRAGRGGHYCPRGELRREILAYFTPEDIDERLAIGVQPSGKIEVSLRLTIGAGVDRRDRAHMLDAVKQLQEAVALRNSLESGAGIATLRDPAFAAALQRAQATAAQLPDVFAQMSTRAGEVKEIKAAVARLQLRADSLRTQLAAASSLLGTGNGSLTRFQQDSALIRAIAKARMDLDSLIAEAKRNPLRFIR